MLGTTWGKIFLADVAVAIFVCCLAIHAMSVRILFAMGRDDNLPGGSRLAHVSGTRRVPVFPAVLVGAIALVVLAFNIYNQYAFEVIIALGIIFMYLAYLGVTIPLLQRRLSGWPGNLNEREPRPLQLGRWAVLTNVLAIIYGAVDGDQPGLAARLLLRHQVVPAVRADHRRRRGRDRRPRRCTTAASSTTAPCSASTGPTSPATAEGD